MHSQIDEVSVTQHDQLFYASTNIASSLTGDHPTTVDTLNRTFQAFFTQQRSDEYNSTIKLQTREQLIKHFAAIGLKVFTQTFVVRTSSPMSGGRVVKVSGVNVIGVLEGNLRKKKSPNDAITVLGGHYDTVELCPGVDDNGSGSVAVMELARLAATRPSIDDTLIFVLFDLEEWVNVTVTSS